MGQKKILTASSAVLGWFGAGEVGFGVMASLPKLLSDDRFLASRIRCPELLRLHRPESAEHFVQFYQDDSFVIDNISYLTAKALEAGDSAIMIATDSHLTALEARLRSFGIELDLLRESARYTALSAADALARIVVDGSPDPEKFSDVIGGVIRRAQEVSVNRFVFAFGEMVAILCEASAASAAVNLERLWNSLAARHRFSLCCAYPLGSLGHAPDADAVLAICAEHALTIPAEKPL